MNSRLLTLIVLMMCVWTFQIATNAQTIYGAVTGQVTDQAGAAVSGAAMTVTNTETGQSREATTNDEGLYRIPGLPVGVYAVRAEGTGFSPAVVERLEVTVAVDAKADIQLGTGGVQETVSVVASGALLETAQSQVSKSVGQTSILELPGRNSLNGLALLNPGVLPNQNGRPGSGFAVNGNRTRSNNFTIDGANNNDQSLSIPRQSLPPEALQEFQIITNTFAAEFGRNAGSYVNQITRSGTNEFHGAGFYAYNGNDFDALSTVQQRRFNALRASDPNSTDKQILRRVRDVQVDNVYGATLGGPVVQNHTFFFTSLDFEDYRTTVSSVSRAALSADSRAAVLANRNRFASPAAADFLLNTFPAANDPTPAGTSLASSTVQARDVRVTCPQSDPNCNVIAPLVFQTYNRTLDQGIPYGTDFGRVLGKINTRINDKDQLSFRYLLDQFDDPGNPASLPGLEIGNRQRNQSFTINDVYALTPTLINEARITYSRRKIRNPEDLASFANGAQLQIGGSFTAFNVGNANFPQFRTDNVFEFTENVAYSAGNHNLKFGANVLRYQLINLFAPNSRGFISYSDLNNFLADQAQLVQQANGDFGLNAITYENSFFAQDDYRVNSDLTLNLGLRYEYVTTPFGFFSNAKSDVNNFGPRLGFAYNPKNFLDGRFVLRGGFAVAYDQVFQNILLNVSRNFPRAVTNSASTVATATSPSTIGAAPFNGFTGALGQFLNQGPGSFPANQVQLLDYRFFSQNERIKQPQSLQVTVSAQYQFGNDYVVKADYINTNGRNLVREVEQNYGFTTASGLGNGQRLDPTRGSILVGQGIADSVYHAGQFTLEKRLSNLNLFGTDFGGLLFNANYTYSSFISESDDVLGGQANRTLPADPRDPKLDRARSAFDQPHRFVASYVYTVPEVLRSNGLLNRVLSGFEISGITTLADGTPFSVLSSTNALGILPGQISTIQLSQRAGLLNPAAIDNSFTVATLNAGQLVIPNPNARYILYQDNIGILPSLGANTERTGGTINTDLSLVKNIRTFGENQRLQFRVEVLNAFNRRNFTAIPANTLSATTTPASFLNLGLATVGAAAASPSPILLRQAPSANGIPGRIFTFGARYFF